MPSAEACFHALEGVLPWLPVVLAWSANSPYFAGEETGLLSNRAEVLAQLPRHGAPPAFRSYAEWEEFAERFISLGLADDYTRFWWDIRPHPRFGTLEIRMPDQPTELERTVGLRRPSQGPVRRGPRTARAATTRPDAGIYQQNRWAASRFGLAAELVASRRRTDRRRHQSSRPSSLRWPGLDGLDPARMRPTASSRWGEPDGLEAVCADLVERTLG